MTINHPGVDVEQRKTGLTPFQGVSSSNLGIAGFTTQGPNDIATRVTSFAEFEKIFGGFTAKSQLATQVWAFFANGGGSAYVVRTTPADATIANGAIMNPIVDDFSFVGNGVTTVFAFSLAHVPINPSTVSIKYYETGTVVVGAAVTPNVAPDGSQLDFAFVIGTKMVPGATSVNTVVGAATVSYTDATAAGELRDSGGDVRGYIDYESGVVTLSTETAAVPDTATAITMDYTSVGTLQTITDDGSGGLTGAGLTGPGTISYTTGAVTFTTTAAPADTLSILASYEAVEIAVVPVSDGAWGNRLQPVIQGSSDYFDPATASYSRYDLLIYLKDEITDVPVLLKTFVGLSVTDATDAKYIASVVNAFGTGSDLITLTEPAFSTAPLDGLNGEQKLRSLGAGDGIQLDFGSTDGTGGTPTIPVAFRVPALPTPIQSGSVSFSYMDSAGTVQTITDDSLGNLTGTGVDTAAPAGFNTVDYTTGAFAVRLLVAMSAAETSHAATPTDPRTGALSSGSTYTTPTNASSTTTMAGGGDGTSLTRNELTNPTLFASRKGVYALLTPDQIMNVAIPDAAGDITMTGDLLTEAERNEKWFIVVATPQGLTEAQAVTYRVSTLGTNTSYGAMYYPWIRITDPVTSLAALIPPAGHIVGVFARTDAAKSVGKAPGGTEDGKLLFSIGLERKMSFADIDVLFANQINALMDTPQTGRVVWGVRTMERPAGDFKYIHARRLFEVLDAVIFNSTHGFVFENVGPALWSSIRLSTEGFLKGLFNQGVFKGTTPQDAYTVICDASNNDQSVQDAGEVICDVYVAINKPGEKIRFRLQQKVTTA